MSGIGLIVLGVTTFTGIILILVVVILFARSHLVPHGYVSIVLNDDPEHTYQVPMGGKLLNTLADQKIFLPSACGGGGSCGECKVIIREGGGSLLPTEASILTRKESRQGFRLACQVTVKDDMKLVVPPEIFAIRKWICRVRSNRSVATFIKELVLEMPEGEEANFRAGAYIQIEAEPHIARYADFEIDDAFRSDWDTPALRNLVSRVDEPVVRAYSMANYPEEKGVIILNVRIATPPPSVPGAPPGQMSSYLFGLKPGDAVTVSGPFGEFFARDTDNEMVFIGGGAGMAPMRSHILDQLKRLKTKRTISFWYGARNLREVFYREMFDALQKSHHNFRWHIALSEPLPEDQWAGPTGFIHQVLYNTYLKDHPAPETCEYYICGPPLMNNAVLKMLDSIGVDQEHILFDDFGG